MNPHRNRPSRARKKLFRAWPLLTCAALTGCQLLFGDFDVLPGEADHTEQQLCEEESTFRCTGTSLYVCVDTGLEPTYLLDCEPPLECDAATGRCVDEGQGTSSSGTGTGDGPQASSSSPSAGGSLAGGDESTTDGSSTTSAAGAPPDTTGECDSEVDDCCPDDPAKTSPGLCGCGVVDTAECAALRAALAHRYSFSEAASTVPDGVQSADGTIVNGAVQQGGVLELAGADSDQYVDLPNGVLSTLVNATIEVWLVWYGGDNWQRVFDFGNSDSGEDARGIGTTYLFLTPSSSVGTLRVAFTTAGNGSETQIETAASLPTQVLSHVAVVVDDDNDSLSLFVDGIEQGTSTLTGQLSALDDVNNWLGRSQFAADPGLAAVLDELRIYRAALTPAQVSASYQAGTNPAFFDF